MDVAMFMARSWNPKRPQVTEVLHGDCGSKECQACWIFYQAIPVPGAPYQLATNEYLVKNGYYQVIVRALDDVGSLQLSIKSLDRSARHDWRHFQRIKNMIAGPEAEAVELYPAESRLVDNANQYWLTCLPSGERFPFGFPGRMVTGGDSFGAKQRPWPDWDRPTDALTPEQAEALMANYQSRKESQ